MRPPLDANLVRTLRATVWMFAGRGVGLLWTLVIISRFGIGDYGSYAMAFAVATLVAVPLDYYYFVGSVRSSDADFRRDRVSRLLLGATLVAIGLAVYPAAFVPGLGIALAGGEISFNALQSTWMRAGRPDRLSTNLTLRQSAGIACAVAYSYGVDDATLHSACLAYLTPYVVSILRTAWLLRRDRPQLPRDPDRSGILFADAVGLVLYHQTDVLLLGTVTGSTTAGYYATAQVTAIAASSVGVSYGQNFHEPLREARGNPVAGPSPRLAAMLGLGIGGAVAVVGGVLALAGVSAQLWGSFLLLSVFTALSFYRHTLVVVLVVQQRDRVRVAWTAAGITVRAAVLGLLALGLGWDALGAATAAVVAESMLVVAYHRLVHRQPRTDPLLPVPSRSHA